MIIQDFDEVYFLIYPIDLLIKSNPLIIQERKDLDLFKIVDGTFETIVPGVGTPVIEIVMQYFQAFDLLIGIIGKGRALVGKHQFFLALIVKYRKKRQYQNNQQEEKGQKT
jgi:hypothetical protein